MFSVDFSTRWKRFHLLHDENHEQTETRAPAPPGSAPSILVNMGSNIDRGWLTLPIPARPGCRRGSNDDRMASAPGRRSGEFAQGYPV